MSCLSPTRRDTSMGTRHVPLTYPTRKLPLTSQSWSPPQLPKSPFITVTIQWHRAPRRMLQVSPRDFLTPCQLRAPLPQSSRVGHRTSPLYLWLLPPSQTASGQSQTQADSGQEGNCSVAISWNTTSTRPCMTKKNRNKQNNILKRLLSLEGLVTKKILKGDWLIDRSWSLLYRLHYTDLVTHYETLWNDHGHNFPSEMFLLFDWDLLFIGDDFDMIHFTIVRQPSYSPGFDLPVPCGYASSI